MKMLVAERVFFAPILSPPAMWIPALHFEMPFFTHKNQIENVFDTITQSHCSQTHSPCVDCVAIAPLSHALHIVCTIRLPLSDIRFIDAGFGIESNLIVSDRVPATSPHSISLCNDLRLNNASHFSLMHTFFFVFNIVSQRSTFAHNEYAINIWYGFEVICNVINKWSFCVWFSALWFDACAHDRIYHQFSYQQFA